MSVEEAREISCEPKTIWSLEEPGRAVAVRMQVQECAKHFKEAVKNDHAGAAQDFAIGALGAIGGLFTDPNDPAHELLQSLVGLIVGAKYGRSDHVLARSTRPIVGTKKGLGHALLGAFAVSAVKLLVEVGLSTRNAGKQFAALLASQGVSLRTDGHGQPKPITAGAIRNWCDRPGEYPLQAAMAAEMESIHAQNLKRRQAVTLDGVITYLRDQAPDLVARSRAL